MYWLLAKDIADWRALTLRFSVRGGALGVKKPDIQHVYQVGSFLLCVFLALQIQPGLDEGGEFAGGWLTGPLFSMEDTGITLFIVRLS